MAEPTLAIATGNWSVAPGGTSPKSRLPGETCTLQAPGTTAVPESATGCDPAFDPTVSVATSTLAPVGA